MNLPNTQSLTIELKSHLSLSLSLKKFYFATRMEAGNEYKKGPWTVEEDRILMDYIKLHGKGKWNRMAKMTGILVLFP